MKVIAFVKRESIGKILDHLGLPSTGPPVAKARLQALRWRTTVSARSPSGTMRRLARVLGGPSRRGRGPGERLRSRRAGALSANSSSRGQSLVQLGSKIPSAAQQQDSPREFPLQFRRDDWSGRQDLNLRPPGPERAPAESHGVSSAGTAAQPPENTGKPEPGSSDGVAENGYVETPFGAPVVRELPADPGPHERLMTVREVASRLGVCTALVYKLCQRNELRPLRIGGALRFHRDAVESFLASRG